MSNDGGEWGWEGLPEDDPDAPARYVDSKGRIIYRASSLGRCERAFIAAARGETAHPWPESFQGFLDEGKAAEALIRARWEQDHESDGWKVAPMLQSVEIEVMDNVFVTGHVDGMFYIGVDNALWEAKKVRASGWDAFLQKGVEWHVNYPWQVAVYMHALKVETCAFVGGLWDVEKQEVTETFTHWLQQPPLPFKAIVKRVRELERVIGAGFAPSEVKCRGDYPCPYFHLHDEPQDKEGKSADVVFIVPKGMAADWAREMALYSAEDEALKSLQTKVVLAEKRKKDRVEAMRKLITSMGADSATEIHGRDGANLVLKRVRYDRKAYEVKAAKIDYFRVEDKHKTKTSKDKPDAGDES